MATRAAAGEGGPRGEPIEFAVRVVAGLIAIAFGVLLVDLVRQRAWFDAVLLVVGGALVALCFLLQRGARPGTG